MSQILIVPKREFDRLVHSEQVVNNRNDIAFISICEPDSDDVPACRSVFDADEENVLRVYTYDIEKDLPLIGRTELAKAFTSEQAKVVIDFIERNRTKKLWLLHCTAGISRSGAVGVFLSEQIGVSYQQLKRDNPQILPNTHILTTLRSALTLTVTDSLP